MWITTGTDTLNRIDGTFNKVSPCGRKNYDGHVIRSDIRLGHQTHQGVLSSRQGAGVFVAALDIARPWQLTIQQTDIIAVIETRMAIEIEAASLAATKRAAADLQDIQQTLDIRKAKRSSIEEHVDADTALHRSIVVAAHNPLLTELFDSFTLRCREAMIAMLRMHRAYGSDSDHDIHIKIVEAIKQRDSDLAATRSRAHLKSLKHWLQ